MSDRSRHERRVAELMQRGEARAAAEEIAAIELGEIPGDVMMSPELRRLMRQPGPTIVEEIEAQAAGAERKPWWRKKRKA